MDSGLIILIFILAFVLGSIPAFLIYRGAKKKEDDSELKMEELRGQISQLGSELSAVRQTAHHASEQKEELFRENADLRTELNQKREDQARLLEQNKSLNLRLEEQKAELSNMQEELKTQFENLANKILEANSEKFSKQNQERIGQLLAPLGIKLEEFKKKVEDTYSEENRQRATLKEQIRQMAELNQRMSDDAKNLTKALKGDSKAQGNWGEVILERILEKSGLTKGREYEVQQSVTTEEGRRLQPDVVVHLPDEKFLIIDSKVSLTAYERFSSAEDEKEAELQIKQHISSIRTHVKGLSEKRYQQIHGDRSPDFVLLFIPIESAFGLALQNDSNLYYEAFDRNIVIVSPSTLLATLATIDSVWKQEYQNKNAQEIAERGGALYDKFVLFVQSLEKVGDRIRQTQESYDEAKTRLVSGTGNLVRQAEMLKELGAKATKKITASLTDLAED